MMRIVAIGEKEQSENAKKYHSEKDPIPQRDDRSIFIFLRTHHSTPSGRTLHAHRALRSIDVAAEGAGDVSCDAFSPEHFSEHLMISKITMRTDPKKIATDPFFASFGGEDPDIMGGRPSPAPKRIKEITSVLLSFFH